MQSVRFIHNFSEYNSAVRPKINGIPTLVTMVPQLFVLLSMNQRRETIEFLGEFGMVRDIYKTWKDPLLAWCKEGVKFTDDWIKLPENSIWVPDVVFYDASSMTDLMTREVRTADVSYNGTVRVSHRSLVTLPCVFNVQSFPYDYQDCLLQLGSWMYSDSEVVMQSITLPPELTSNIQGNNEWGIIHVLMSEVLRTDYTSKNFSIINYSLRLKRRSAYYILVIQVTLGLTMLLSIFFVFNLVADMMPKTQKLPLLGNYILVEIFLCTIAIFVSICILFIHHKLYTRGTPYPQWLRKATSFKKAPLRLFLLGSSSFSEQKRRMIMLSTDSSLHLQQLIQLSFIVDLLVFRFASILGRLEKRRLSRRSWGILFDTVDVFFLIIFQFLNIVAALLYMSPLGYIEAKE